MKVISYIFYGVILLLLSGVLSFAVGPESRPTYYAGAVIVLMALLVGAAIWRGIKRSSRSK